MMPPQFGAFVMKNPSSDSSAMGNQFIHVGDASPVILVIAASALAAAFQKMAGHDPSRQVVPVVRLPAEFMKKRR